MSLVLPSAGGIVDVFTADGQGYIREVQKDLTPWLISVAGFRWHNRVSREFLLQILRYLSIARGGVFAHWDALALRSQKSNNVDELAKKFSMSHAHAAANHQARIRDMIKRLFLQSPAGDLKMRFIKQEVFGIEDGAPIMADDHPAINEMFEQPITGALDLR